MKSRSSPGTNCSNVCVLVARKKVIQRLYPDWKEFNAVDQLEEISNFSLSQQILAPFTNITHHTAPIGTSQDYQYGKRTYIINTKLIYTLSRDASQDYTLYARHKNSSSTTLLKTDILFSIGLSCTPNSLYPSYPSLFTLLQEYLIRILGHHHYVILPQKIIFFQHADLHIQEIIPNHENGLKFDAGHQSYPIHSKLSSVNKKNGEYKVDSYKNKRFVLYKRNT